MSRRYAEEFKRDVVGQVLRSDRTIRVVATDLGLPATTVQRWLTKYGGEMSGDGVPDIDALVEDNRRLLAENQELLVRNAELEEDREILKKLQGSSPRKRRTLRVHPSRTGESFCCPVMSGGWCSEIIVHELVSTFGCSD